MTGAVGGNEFAHDAHLRVMAARVIAQQRWPYVSSILFSLKLVPVRNDELATMAVDSGWRLYYSPRFVLNQTPETLATVLLHESMHCLHDHAGRFSVMQRPKEHVTWNVAGDAGINTILDEAKMPWPSVEPIRIRDLSQWHITEDMTTEGIFFRLLEVKEEQSFNPDCGSITDKRRRIYELAPSHDVSPALRIDQQAVVRDRTAQDILKRNRNHGDVPAGLLRWAEEILEPTVGWREELASRMRRDLAMVAGRRDYVYTRPSRRQSVITRVGSTVVLPAMRQPMPPRVACVIDTSGSISDSELRDFASELVGITRASGVSGGVTVIPCDASAGPITRIRNRSEIERLELPGGGGTDMGAGIQRARELKPLPHILVIFTDGHTPWPEAPPREFSSVIVVLSDSTTRECIPPWTRVIELNDAHQSS